MLSKAQQTIVDITGYDYRESGSSDEIYMDCPFCGKANKLYISNRGQWICFRCETKGRSVTSFVMQYHDCSVSEAKELLQDYGFTELTAGQDANIGLIKQDSLFTALSNMRETIQQMSAKLCPPMPTNVKPLITNLNNPESYPYLWYLKGRGITLEEIEYFNICYVVNGELGREDKKPLHIEKSIVFPTYDQLGRQIYWNTRSIEVNPYIKSLNAPAKDNEYSKRDTLFNMNHVTNHSDMVICEGVFNAITSTIADYVGIATFGKAITDDQIKLMVSLNPKNYYIFLDNDALKQELELTKRLYNQGVSYDRMYLVKNPYGEKDANDIGKAKTHQLLNQAHSVSLKDLIELSLRARIPPLR